MGLACSKTAVERLNALIDIVNESSCLTVYAVSALLPIESKGVPVYIFGEDHAQNESQLPENKNCLKVIDALNRVSSQNCTEDNKIIFLYEGSTVSDKLFYGTDKDIDLRNIDSAADDVNILGSRYAVKRRLQVSHHIKAVPYDVFGRIRNTLYGQRERNSLLTAPHELQAFWDTVGYTVYEEQFVQISKLAKMLADKMLLSFYGKFPKSDLDYYDVKDAFMCYFLAILNFKLHPETPMRTSCRQRAEADVLELINGVIMSEIPESNPKYFVPKPEDITLEEYRNGMKDSALFTLVAMAVDLVILEYLTGPTWREDNDHLVVMHVGYRHGNNVQRWLKAGTHHAVYQKTTTMATRDDSYLESLRGHF